jgi:hypothetical protein
MPKPKSFRKLFDHIYSSNDGIDERIAALPDAERKAFKIIDSVLGGRKGFDYWWVECERSDQSEMFGEIMKVIANG